MCLQLWPWQISLLYHVLWYFTFAVVYKWNSSIWIYYELAFHLRLAAMSWPLNRIKMPEVKGLWHCWTWIPLTDPSEVLLWHLVVKYQNYMLLLEADHFPVSDWNKENDLKMMIDPKTVSWNCYNKGGCDHCAERMQRQHLRICSSSTHFSHPIWRCTRHVVWRGRALSLLHILFSPNAQCF